MNDQQEQEFYDWLKDGLSESYGQEVTDDQLQNYLQTDEGQQMANALYLLWQQNPNITFEEAVTYIQQALQQQVQSAKFGAKLNYLRTLKGQCPKGYEIGYYKAGGRICKACVKKQEGGTVENNNNTGEEAIKEFKRGHKMKKCAVGGATDSKEMNVPCPCHKKKVSKKEGGGGTNVVIVDKQPELIDNNGSPYARTRNGKYVLYNEKTGKWELYDDMATRDSIQYDRYKLTGDGTLGLDGSGEFVNVFDKNGNFVTNHFKPNRNSEYYKKSESVKKRQEGGNLGNKDYDNKFMSYSAFTPNSGLTTLTDLFKDYYM